MTPARIGIDLTAYRTRETGVDRCLRELVEHLAKVDTLNRYHLFVLSEHARVWGGLPENYRVRPLRLPGRVGRFVFQQAALPVLATRLGLDVLHSPSFFMPWVRGRPRHVLSVYDMTFFSRPELHTALRGSYPFRLGVRTSIRRATSVIVPSEHVRRDLLARVAAVRADRVRVIRPGVSERFRSPSAGATRSHSPYVLFTGTLEPRKDLETLLSAFATLAGRGSIREELWLAGGAGWGYQPLLARLRAPPLDGRVRWLGYVPDAELPSLYSGARLFVYTSVEEGFGLPPLEAMASGTPTIASDNSSLRENLLGAARLVPARDPGALADALEELLSDEELRRGLALRGAERARHFRWDQAAAETLECYRSNAVGRSSNLVSRSTMRRSSSP